MPAVEPGLPDVTDQTASEYKNAIDSTAQIHDRIAGMFCGHQSSAGSPAGPDMTVTVAAGAVFNGASLSEVAEQVSGTLTAPAANPRRDIVYIDRLTGAVGVATGAEAASPSDPAIPSGKIPVARIALTVGMTEIDNNDITDLRAGMGFLGLTAALLLSILPAFTGAVGGSPSSAGSAGLVPAPADGDDAKFLRGDGEWAAAGGGWEDIEAQSGPAASYDFTTGFDPTRFRNYRLLVKHLRPVSDAILNGRTSTDGGATWDSSNAYQWSGAGRQVATGVIGTDSALSNQLQFTTDKTVDSGSSYGANGWIIIENPGAVALCPLKWSLDFEEGSGNYAWIDGKGRRGTAANVDAIQIFFNGVNIADGEVILQGEPI